MVNLPIRMLVKKKRVRKCPKVPVRNFRGGCSGIGMAFQMIGIGGSRRAAAQPHLECHRRTNAAWSCPLPLAVRSGT